eukprot:7814784-Pyramimonas_sp.AAC.2
MPSETPSDWITPSPPASSAVSANRSIIDAASANHSIVEAASANHSIVEQGHRLSYTSRTVAACWTPGPRCGRTAGIGLYAHLTCMK